MANNFSDQLRVAIETCPLTRADIAERADVLPSQLSRFMNRKAGLAVDSIDRLCKVLGLKLVSESKPKRKAIRKGG